MVTFVYVVFTFVCLFLISVVLLQPGKSGGLGAAFGGGSNTVFGASGATTMLQKVTIFVATSFMFLSLLLAYLSTGSSVTTGEDAVQRKGLDFSSVGGSEILPVKQTDTGAVEEAVPSVDPVAVPAVEEAAPADPVAVPVVEEAAPADPVAVPAVEEAAPVDPVAVPAVEEAVPSVDPVAVPAVEEAVPSVDPVAVPVVEEAVPSVEPVAVLPAVEEAAPADPSVEEAAEVPAVGVE